MTRGRLIYVNRDLLDEINRRKTGLNIRNSDIMKEIALDSKIGQEAKKMMKFWGIFK